MIEINDLPQGWFDPADVKVYRDLVLNVPKGGKVCELGVWKGRSICSIADIIIDNDLTVYAIDTFEGSRGEEAHEGIDKTKLKKEFVDNIDRYGLSENVVVLEGRTDSKYRNFQDRFFDLLFIDADHSKESVISDIRNWSPKIKRWGHMAGHDFTWSSVRDGLTECSLITWIKLYAPSSVWSIKMRNAVIDNGNVTAVVCTKDRYDSLYSTILALVNQTQQPQFLLIYDDSAKRENLPSKSKWRSLFDMLEHSSIHWMFITMDDNKKGQVRLHEDALKRCSSEFIWRVDDDMLPERTVLERLYKSIASNEDIAAVGGAIITDGINFSLAESSSNIEDILVKPNLQWVRNSTEIRFVDHLHGSFLFRKNLDLHYDDRLSPVGHREETLFTYSMTKKGHKLLVDLGAKTYHSKNDKGGIRSNEYTQEMFRDDEKIFMEIIGRDIKTSVVMPKDGNLCIIEGGIGDHFMFLSILEDILKSKKRIMLGVSYLEVFEKYFGDSRVFIVSVDQAGQAALKAGLHKSDFNIYRFCARTHWNKHLTEAFKKLYLG